MSSLPTASPPSPFHPHHHNHYRHYTSTFREAYKKDLLPLLRDLTLLSQTFFILFLSYLVSVYSFSILYIFLIVSFLLLSLYRANVSSSTYSILLFQRSILQPNVLRKHVQQAGQRLPAWINFAETEKVEWLEQTVAKLWPSVKSATEEVLLASLGPILTSVKPAVLTHLGLSKLDLGSIPPALPGVRLQPSTGNEVMLDMDLEFLGNPIITIEARTVALPVYATLADFQMRGTIRVLLKPLINEWPCFTALCVSFTQKPTIHFKLETVGMNMMAIPGLNDMLYSIINEQFFCPHITPSNTQSYNYHGIDGTPPAHEQRWFYISKSFEIWCRTQKATNDLHRGDVLRLKTGLELSEETVQQWVKIMLMILIIHTGTMPQEQCQARQYGCGTSTLIEVLTTSVIVITGQEKSRLFPSRLEGLDGTVEHWGACAGCDDFRHWLLADKIRKEDKK